MTLVLRWAAIRAILMFSLIVKDKVTRRSSQTTIFEENGEPKRIRTEVPLLTARPNRLTLFRADDEVELHILGCRLTC